MDPLNKTSIFDPMSDLDLTINFDYESTSYPKDWSEMLGPKRDPLYIVIPITVMYLVIFVTGVIGNISTCIVISRNKSMHTATNYYLFSLAMSDLLLLLAGLPQEMWSIWSRYPYVFGEAFCIMRGLAAETSANATVLTITAFTIERYVAICHPFLSHTMSKLSRAIKLILIIWVISLSFALPQALQFGIIQQHHIDICQIKRIILEHSFELSTFLFFVTPMTLITVLYALIGCRLRASSMMKREISIRHRRHKEGLRNGELKCNNNGQVGARSEGSRKRGRTHAHGQSSRRVLKMLVAVVVAFFICWAPFHAQRLVAIYGPNVNPHTIEQSRPFWLAVYTALTYVSGVLYYASTCINPLLYNIMSNKFREAFKETLSRTCTCCGVSSDVTAGAGGINTGSGRYSALARNGDPKTTNVQVTAHDVSQKSSSSRIKLNEALNDSSMSYSGNSQSYRCDDYSQSQSPSYALSSTMTSPYRHPRNSTDSGKFINKKLLGNGKALRRIWQRLAKPNARTNINTNNAMVHNDISMSLSTHLTEVKIDAEPLNSQRSPSLVAERTGDCCRTYFDNQEPNNSNTENQDLTSYTKQIKRKDLSR